METKRIENSPHQYDDQYEHEQPLSSWLPIDLGPAVRGERVALAPTVLSRDDGVMLLYRDRLNSLVGETESCKSWIALIAIAQELRLGNHVVFLDFEDSDTGIVERLQSLGVSDGQLDGPERTFHYVNPDGPFTDTDRVLLVEEFIDKYGSPSLVVIDGITGAFAQAGLSPDSGVEVAAFYDQSPRWFARQGAAVLLIDHVTKSAESRNGYAIGSERKKSGIDGAMYTVETITPFGRGKTGIVKLSVVKDRPGHVRAHTTTNNVIATVKLTSSFDGSVVTTITAPRESVSGPFKPIGIMERMSEILAQSPDGIGLRQLRLAVKGKNETKDAAIEILVNEGFVKVTHGSNNTKIHTSLKPYPPVDEGSDDEIF